jgi:hypothetical protein
MKKEKILYQNSNIPYPWIPLPAEEQAANLSQGIFSIPYTTHPILVLSTIGHRFWMRYPLREAENRK